MATIVTRAGKGAALTHQEVDANFTGLNTELGQKEVASNKGVANGYASLDVAGKVPSAQLPSYVDDVVEVANFASLPGTGETGKIYVTIDTNKTYRWTGSTYIEISASPGSTDSLAEGSTNLYFTQARARASLSASGSLSYNSGTGVISFTDAVTSVAGRTGAVTLTSSDVGLGSVENKSSATIRGELTSSNVTTALGFTPYNATNPSGYITSSASITGNAATATTATNLSGGTVSATTGAFSGLVNIGGVSTMNTTTPGTAVYNVRLNGASTPDQVQAITWSYHNLGDSQAGIYVQSSGAYGTKMYLATTDSFASGAKTAVSIDHSGNVNIARGALTQGGNQVLHAGNYSSYAPTLTGTGASGTWGINITGNAATVTNGVTSGNVTSFAIPASTNFGSGDLNQAYNSGLYGFDVPSNSPGFSYGHILVMRGRGDTIGQLAIDYSSGVMSFRGAYLPNGSSTVGAAWSSWRRALDSANYTNYSPSLTGSGASGTWGINITGNAATSTVMRYVGYAGDVGNLASAGTGIISNYNTVGAWTGAPSGMSYGSVYHLGGSAGGSVLSLQIAADINHNSSSSTKQLWFRTSNNLGFQNDWKELLHSGNYTNYSPSLTGSGASGTWGISISGSAAQLNGYSSAESGASVVLRTASNGYLYINNWIHVASGGVFSSTNSAHFTPNNGSYGPWKIQGTRNGWSGIEFDSGVALMTNRNSMGLYDVGYGWTLYWSGGTGYVNKNANGGGTQAAILDSVNYTSYAPSLTGSGASGSWSITAARATRANGNLYIDDNYGNGIVGVYASTRYQGVFFMGDSYKMSADGTSLANMYGIGWSHPNAGGAAGNLTDHGMLIINNGSFRCAISNSIVASGNITAYSDERLKKNWRDMPDNFVERLSQVRVGRYERIDDGVQQVGVSAQSLQPLLPEAIQVSNDEMKTLSVSYGNAALAAAVELAKELVALKHKVAELEARVH